MTERKVVDRSFGESLNLWERISRDADGKVANVFEIAPDWTIEILSPDQSQTKVVRNILYCISNGTQMGWLIDPAEELVFVYRADYLR
nr:Uma2 family endonuclease [Chamaesiphon sp. VAR_48_metabat_403]